MSEKSPEKEKENDASPPLSTSTSPSWPWSSPAVPSSSNSESTTTSSFRYSKAIPVPSNSTSTTATGSSLSRTPAFASSSSCTRTSLLTASTTTPKEKENASESEIIMSDLNLNATQSGENDEEQEEEEEEERSPLVVPIKPTTSTPSSLSAPPGVVDSNARAFIDGFRLPFMSGNGIGSGKSLIGGGARPFATTGRGGVRTGPLPFAVAGGSGGNGGGVNSSRMFGPQSPIAQTSSPRPIIPLPLPNQKVQLLQPPSINNNNNDKSSSSTSTPNKVTTSPSQLRLQSQTQPQNKRPIGTRSNGSPTSGSGERRVGEMLLIRNADTAGLEDGEQEEEEGSPHPAKKVKTSDYDYLDGLKLRLKNKDEEILLQQTSLLSQKALLTSQTSEIETLKSQLSKVSQDTQAFKIDIKKKVKSALTSVKSAHEAFENTSKEVRAKFDEMQEEFGSPIIVEEIRDEIQAIKDDLRETFFKDGDFLLERNEDCRIKVLKLLHEDHSKYQNTIKDISSVLSTKTGELMEARDEIASLRQTLVDSCSQKIESSVEREERVVELGTEIKELGKEMKERGKKYEELLGEFAEITEKLREVEKVRDEGLERVQRLTTELEESQKVKKELMEELEQSGKDLNTSEELSKEALRLAELDRQQAVGATREEGDRKVHQIQIKLDEANVELEGIRRTLALAQEKAIRLKNELEDAQNSATEETSRLQALLDEARCESERSLERLAESGKAAQEASRIAAEEHSADLAKQRQLEECITTLEAKINDITREVAFKDEVLDQERMKSFESRLQEVGELQEKIQVLEEAKDAAESEVVELKNAVGVASTRCSSLENEIELLKQQQVLTSSELEATKLEKGQLASSLETIKLDKDQLSLELVSQSTKLASANQEIQQLSSTVAIQSSMTTKLESDVVGYAAIVQAQKDEIQSVLSVREDEIKKARAEVMNKCNDNLDVQLKLKSNEVRQIKNKYDNVSQKLEQALAELTKLKSKPQPVVALPNPLPPQPLAPVARAPSPVSTGLPEVAVQPSLLVRLPANPVTMTSNVNKPPQTGPHDGIFSSPLTSAENNATKSTVGLTLSAIDAQPESDPIIDSSRIEYQSPPPPNKRAQRKKADPPAPLGRTPAATTTRRRIRSVNESPATPRPASETLRTLAEADDIEESDDLAEVNHKPRPAPKTTYVSGRKKK